MTNYISYSVFGQEDIYLIGALRNAELQKVIYPGWKSIFYVDEALRESDYFEKLLETGSTVVLANHSLSKNKRSWRFAAALVSDAEYVIFRDADSRLGIRESAAVMEWLKSEKPLHIMRDHPFHSDWILAGMWGAHAPSLASAVSKVLSEGRTSNWGEDQFLLAKHVYLDFVGRATIHDSFFSRERGALSFPLPREEDSFVGERVSALEVPEFRTRQILANYESSKFLQKKLRIRDWVRRLSFAARTRKGKYFR